METDQFLTELMEDEELLEFVGSRYPETKRVTLFNFVATKLLEKYEASGSMEDLDRAISVEEKIIAFIRDDYPNRGMYLNDLAKAFHNRFERTGSMEDLDRSIALKEQVVATIFDANPNRGVCLINLADELRTRFQRQGSMEDLNRAIMMNEQVITSIPDDDPNCGLYLSTLAIALRVRFERTGSKNDLDRAISTNEQAVTFAPDGHPNRGAYLNNLGVALYSRFERMGSMEDLDRAITSNEQAVTYTPDDHPDRAVYLTNLGNGLQSRFERTRSIDDLERAISSHEQAVASTLDNHPLRGLYLNNLSGALQNRFERTGSIDDLDRAIIASEQAVMSIPDDHYNRRAILNNLGRALQRRFEQTGSIEDLDRAIKTNEQAVASTPDDHPDQGMCLNNLGAALQRRFQRTGSAQDIERAIMASEQAVASTPNDHPNRGMYLNILGISLRNRFERMGSMNDLERAIRTNEQAVESTPDDHPDRGVYLDNLGNALQRGFDQTGSMDDLDRAIRAKEQAVAFTPEDHPNRGMHLNNLGIAFQSRFGRTGCMDDLNQAISVDERAVASTSKDHPRRGVYLNNLGVALQNRFERTGFMDDIDRAIETNEQAVASTSDDHPDRGVYLNNLGTALQRRFEQTQSMDDLNRAKTMYERAIAFTPSGHPNRGMYLNNLGNVFHKRFEMIGSMDDIDRAISMKEQAFATDTAPPVIRLKAASSCSNLLISQRLYKRAKSILHEAVRLLPTISPRMLKRSDQQYNLSLFANITSRSVSLSLEDKEDPYKSLQLLELGRGILANLQLEVRFDISELEVCHPNLAQRFHSLRDRIDTPVIADSSVIFNPDSSAMSISITERRALFKEFDNLLRFIRSVDGFENFLLGPSETELRCSAQDGPIVVYNISSIRSDAFLITTDKIRSLHLPLLTSDALEDFTKRFISSTNNRTLKRYKQTMVEANATLEWLWDVAVNPVLDELGFTQMPSDDEVWPRVWWVGSGLLNILPIHASGYHDSTPRRTALDLVISSYAPTVKSLLYARERAARVNKVVMEKALAIAMPTTPDQKNLPYVKEEVEILKSHFSNMSINTTIIQNPTRAEALSELSKHTIAHFACHGYSADDPSQSSFYLEDWKTEPLTVSDLMSLKIETAKFAYLSACHTSTMRNFRLLNESISLSSAIQLCGYPSVVGSLWQISDSHSAEVAEDVYAWILGGECGLDIQRSAQGLHKAVRDLRDRTRLKMKQDPLIWAPFIHVGI